MSLFDGVQNFTPAFTGQQLAIQSGQGAGQSISRGRQVAQRQQMVDFETDMKALDTWAARRKAVLTKPSSSSVAVPWNQMPIPGAKGPRTGVAVPWDEMPIPDMMESNPTPAYGGVIGSGGPIGMGVP